MSGKKRSESSKRLSIPSNDHNRRRTKRHKVRRTESSESNSASATCINRRQRTRRTNVEDARSLTARNDFQSSASGKLSTLSHILEYDSDSLDEEEIELESNIEREGRSNRKTGSSEHNYSNQLDSPEADRRNEESNDSRGENREIELAEIDLGQNSVLSETVTALREAYSQLLETDKYRQRRHSRKKSVGVQDTTSYGSASSNCSEDIEKNWERMYDKVDEGFLYSEEAKMRVRFARTMNISGKFTKEKYAGLDISQDNCFDMQYLFLKEFGHLRKRNSTLRSQTESNLKNTLGQLARAAIANEAVVGDCLYQRGEFFRIAFNVDLFEVFIGHFEIDVTEVTAMTKARHCIVFTRAASEYFKENPRYPGNSKKNGALEKKIEDCLVFLRTKAAENKRGARIEAAMARNSKARIESGRTITEQDFGKFREIARECLSSILSSYNRMAGIKKPRDHTERQALIEDLFSDNRLLSKWGLNMLALLMMYGNGQRTQVYTLLKVPDSDYLTEFLQLSKKERNLKPFMLDIEGCEKRQRDIILSSVLFCSTVSRYIGFHVCHVLPYLYKKFNIPVGDIRRQYFFLHTIKGSQLSTYSVRKSIRRFCKSIDNEIHVTPTVLRASYASYMVKEYVRGAAEGKFMWGKDQENFITMLAKVMNTSVEMVTEVYASATQMQYNEFVAKMLGIIESDEIDADFEV